MSNDAGIPDIADRLSKNVKRLPIILCEDISGSMAPKRNLMNEELEYFFGIREIEPAVCRRTDISIIQFSDRVSDPVCSPLSKYIFEPFPDSLMGGTTHLWSALDKAIQLSEKYIDDPQYWAPWILLYTDGFANDEPEEFQDEVIKKLQAYEAELKLVIFILGIGDRDGNIEELNSEILERVSIRGKRVVFYAQEQELDISRFFQVMICTITKTMSNIKYFIRNADNQLILDIDKLVDDVTWQERKRWKKKLPV